MATLGVELAALFRRDLTRLAQEVRAFPDDGALWNKAPGIPNAAGNLILHLEGNLREYIGRQLGGVAYQRRRDVEFGAADLTAEELSARIEALLRMIPEVIAGLAEDDLNKTFPEQVWGSPISTIQFLISLHGHFNYHLGQIDYLRRVLTQGGPVAFVQL